VLLLVEWHLCLDEMTPEAYVESSRMTLAALSIDEVVKRVKGTVGKANYTVLVPMRPKLGYVSLASH
jgi:hypothetical protein